MGVKHNPKRDRHIDAARAAVTKIGTETLPPEILFGGASNDDLDLYSPDMLALTAAPRPPGTGALGRRQAAGFGRDGAGHSAGWNRGLDHRRHRTQHALPL
ncbi:hypothetical protein ABIA25_003709 [Sinorhizobium fredii]